MATKYHDERRKKRKHVVMNAYKYINGRGKTKNVENSLDRLFKKK